MQDGDDEDFSGKGELPQTPNARHRRRRRAIWIVGPLATALLLFPEYLGLLLPGGRGPLWVGPFGVGLNRDGGPVVLWVKSLCVKAVDGFIPPYRAVVIDATCEKPDGVTVPDFMEIEIHGREDVDPDRYAAAASFVEPERETPMTDSPLSGYRGTLLGRDESKGKGRTAMFVSTVRFVATDKDAVAKVLRCNLAWVVTEEGPKLKRGVCFSYGVYRQVLFEARLSLNPPISEFDISHTIGRMIDQMLGAH